MSDLRIVVDTTGYIKKDFIEKNRIKIAPLCVTFEGETKPEGFPGEFDEFYYKLSNSEGFPTTSQPSIGKFKSIFEELTEESPNSDILVLTLSSKLSGAYTTALNAKDMVNNDRIHIIDSLASVANLKHLVKYAIDLNKEGKNIDEIVELIEEQKHRTRVYVTVSDLNYLKRGGRISVSEAFIGNVLKIKPIIQLKEGSLSPIDKVRGRKKSLERIIALMDKEPKYFSICHIQAEKEANLLKEKVLEVYPNLDIDIDEIGPVIGSHLGPESVGYCYLY